MSHQLNFKQNLTGYLGRPVSENHTQAMKLTAIWLLIALPLYARDAWRFPITSSENNQRTETWKLTNRKVRTKSKVKWSVEKTTLHGGKQEGVELVTIDNGRLQITVIPTRGMSVLDVKSGDMRLGWDSPVKEVVHPHFVDLESRGGLGWLEGFNEWMVRCGLEFAGHPGKDEFINNVGDKAEMTLTLHGKVGNIPASEVEVLVDKSPPHRIRVRGVVYEKFFYGPKLKLVAEISTVPGTDTFRIDDTITNLGAFDQEFQIIYHGNFGSPLLEKNARVHSAARSVTPMNAHAAKAAKSYATYAGPTKGFIEEVYLLEPYADASGNSMVVIQNAAGDRAASVRFNTKQLPYLTIWKNTAASDDGYVTGIEPATGYPFNRKVERSFGRVPKLKPNQTRRFTLDFGLHVGVTAAKSAIGQVKAILGSRNTAINLQPPKID